jgi:hypothetical protein
MFSEHLRGSSCLAGLLDENFDVTMLLMIGFRFHFFCRNLIQHMVLLGIALLGRALVPTSLTLWEVYYTSLWTRSMFFSSELR